MAPPRTYSITVTLAFAIGTLVAVGVLAVLALGLQSAQKNTLELIRDQAALILVSQGALVDQNLDPVQRQLGYLARLVASGRLDPANRDQMIDTLTGALAGVSQVTLLSFVQPDLSVLSISREDGSALVLQEDWSRIPEAQHSMADIRSATGPVWGELVGAPSSSAGAFINARVPLMRDGQFNGALVALVSTAQLSRFVERLGAGLGGNGRAFILYGPDRVLAHPALRDGFRRADDAPLLPALDEVGDQVLAAI